MKLGRQTQPPEERTFYAEGFYFIPQTMRIQIMYKVLARE